MIRGRLNEDEADIGMTLAKKRRALNHGGTNLPNGETATPEARLQQDIAACFAEIAVCKYFNLWWSGCGRGSDGRADVGERLEVRSIRSRTRGLQVSSRDREAIYILVFVDVETRAYEILGWELASVVREKGRALHANCSILPQELLKSIDLLPWRRAQ